MNQVHLVKQEHDTGCGIASVAMCAGWSYEETFQKFKNALFWGSRKRKFYTGPSRLERVLIKEKIIYWPRKSSDWSNIDGTAIVGVNRKNGYWHWVVVVRDERRFLIIDPETGELYRYAGWPGEYKHGPGRSTYFHFGSAATNVCIQ